MFIMCFSWLVDSSYLCHLLAVAPYQSTGQMVISTLVLKWHLKMGWVHLARNKSSLQKWQRCIHWWERLCYRNCSFVEERSVTLFQQRYKPTLLNQPQSHFVSCFGEVRDLARPQRSGRGMLRDHCQRQRSALRLQQLSSNRSPVCPWQSNAQFLLAKIQLLLTRKPPRTIQFHCWLISHGCCMSYSYWQRDTSDSAALYVLPSQLGNLLLIPQAERQWTRQQQLK